MAVSALELSVVHHSHSAAPLLILTRIAVRVKYSSEAVLVGHATISWWVLLVIDLFRSALHELIGVLVGVAKLVIDVHFRVAKSLGEVAGIFEVLVEKRRILLLHDHLLQVIAVVVVLLGNCFCTQHHHCLLGLRSLIDNASVVPLILGACRAHEA